MAVFYKYHQVYQSAESDSNFYGRYAIYMWSHWIYQVVKKGNQNWLKFTDPWNR